jgi:hypothetical protein
VNNIDTDGATAVFWAFRRYHADGTASDGVRVDACVRDKTGKTVLHWAARSTPLSLAFCWRIVPVLLM